MSEEFLHPLDVYLTEGGTLGVVHNPSGVEIEVGTDGSISGGPAEYIAKVLVPHSIWVRCTPEQRRLLAGEVGRR